MVTLRPDATAAEIAAVQARLDQAMPDLLGELVCAAEEMQVPVYGLFMLVFDGQSKAEAEAAAGLQLAEPGPLGLVYVILRGDGADGLLAELGLAPLEPGEGAVIVSVLDGVEIQSRATLQLMAAGGQA